MKEFCQLLFFLKQFSSTIKDSITIVRQIVFNLSLPIAILTHITQSAQYQISFELRNYMAIQSLRKEEG